MICEAGRGREDGDGDSSVFDDDGNQEQGTSSLRDQGDSSLPPPFSLAAVEDEQLKKKTRSTPEKATWGNAVVAGGGTKEGGGQDGGDDGDVTQPLLELPLDGIVLQLLPALLIAVVVFFLTIAVQVEAGRFDGIVGDDSGAVVVTDIRDTTF